MAGGGIGEAALIGAALGGASSAIKGGDPLEGAVLGGITGGAGGALFGAGAAGAESLISSAPATAGVAESFAIPEAAKVAMTELPNAVTPASLEALNIPQVPYGTFGGTTPASFQDTSLAFMSAPPAPPTLPSYVEQAPVSVGADQAAKQAQPGIFDKAMGWAEKNPLSAGMLGIGALGMLAPTPTVPGSTPYQSSFDRNKFKPSLPQNAVYTPRYAVGGGIANLSGSDDYANDGVYSSPLPMASGGIASLGGYSDGGRMLKGPGNGTSDSIPASIAGKQPARLADGEFVVPARIVSELGNGSSDAGARELYKMMDRVQKARAKTVGKDKIAVDAKARTRLPA